MTWCALGAGHSEGHREGQIRMTDPSPALRKSMTQRGDKTRVHVISKLHGVVCTL